MSGRSEETLSVSVQYSVLTTLFEILTLFVLMLVPNTASLTDQETELATHSVVCLVSL